MSDRNFTMLFYLALLVVAGTGEYFHLVPMGTLAFMLGGVVGHGLGQASNGAFKLNGNGKSSKNGVTTPIP